MEKQTPWIKFSKIKEVYLVGIKGVAMTALAEILSKKGIKVSGSDTEDVFFTDELLKKTKAQIYKGFFKENISQKFDLVIHSTAYNRENNPEIIQALKLKIPTLSYPEFLASIFNDKFGIAVCGTHGKTTTTAMLAEILRANSFDPWAVVGSKVKNWGTNSLSGEGKYFVIEADEYQNKLQFYKPKGVVATNVEWDHPDFFKNEQHYQRTFRDFFRRIPPTGFLVYNKDDQNLKKITNCLKCKKISFGENKKADYRLVKRAVFKSGQEIEFASPKRKKRKIKIKCQGKWNALNALGALVAAEKMGVVFKKIVPALAKFNSTERRFQFMGKKKGALLYDDYAHHPSEIKAVLSMVREIYPQKKINVAFHPHTYSRTATFLKNFAFELSKADRVYVMKIYASAREKKVVKKISSQDLTEEINKFKKGKAYYIPTLKLLKNKLEEELDSDTIFISMGAGDIWKIHQAVLKSK